MLSHFFRKQPRFLFVIDGLGKFLNTLPLIPCFSSLIEVLQSLHIEFWILKHYLYLSCFPSFEEFDFHGSSSVLLFIFSLRVQMTRFQANLGSSAPFLGFPCYKRCFLDDLFLNQFKAHLPLLLSLPSLSYFLELYSFSFCCKALFWQAFRFS